MYPEGIYKELSDEIPLHTEAPAVIKKDQRYYMIGSGSTGWAPNAARSFSMRNLFWGYENIGNPCVGINPMNRLGKDRTFGGQISFIIPVSPDCYIAMFDIWNPEKASDGLYIWLPLQVKDGKLIVEWKDQWSL